MPNCISQNPYKYLIGAEDKQKGKYLWEFFLELANWQYYLRDYYHYTEIKDKKHREEYISDIIDKLSSIRIMIEDIKKHVVVNGVKEAEKNTVTRILNNVEIGIADLSDKIKLLF